MADKKPQKLSGLRYDFDLSAEEIKTFLWAKIRRTLERKVQELRISNDRPHDEIRTAAIRAEIRVLKDILRNDPTESVAQHPALVLDDMDASE